MLIPSQLVIINSCSIRRPDDDTRVGGGATSWFLINISLFPFYFQWKLFIGFSFSRPAVATATGRVVTDVLHHHLLLLLQLETVQQKKGSRGTDSVRRPYFAFGFFIYDRNAITKADFTD